LHHIKDGESKQTNREKLPENQAKGAIFSRPVGGGKFSSTLFASYAGGVPFLEIWFCLGVATCYGKFLEIEHQFFETFGDNLLPVR
jgi:hypothetical protein